MRASLIIAAAIVLISSLLAGAVGAQVSDAVQQPSPRKPNIVLILADDMGYADLGYQGCTDIPTPNIDALARAGVRFSDAYASAPVCAPSRAGLITGRYQQRFGFEFNTQGEDRAELHTLAWPETTLPAALDAAGYTTALIGKWHLGPLPRFGPQKHGFDEFFGFFVKSRQSRSDEGTKVWRGKQRIEEQQYITFALAREAVDFIERSKAEPFFLQLAFNAPHANLDAPAELLSKFQAIENPRRRNYAAVMSAMDEAIGRVVDKLRVEGLEQDTIIVFLSDNGGPTVHDSSINGSRNTPLRGSKEQLFEGGIRVPMLMVWPGHIAAGSLCSQPVIHLDLMPMFLAAAGVEIEPQWKLDGINLLPHLNGTDAAPPHEYLFWRFGDAWGVRHGDWKLVKADSQHAVALYDLKADISEREDVSSAHPEIVEKLEGAWRQWSSQLQPPAWDDNKNE